MDFVQPSKIVTIVGATLCCIVIYSGIYVFDKANEHKSYRHVHIRRPFIVRWICLASILHLLFERPFQFLFATGTIPKNLLTRLLYNVLPMLPTICFLGCYRAVLLYMDIMTNSVSTGSDIAKSLGILRRASDLPPNSSENSRRPSFFNRRQSTRSNTVSYNDTPRRFLIDDDGASETIFTEQFTMIVLGIPCLLYIVIHLGLIYFVGEEETNSSIVISLCCVLLPIFLSAFLLFKIPETSDPFMLKSEMLSICISLLICVIISLVCGVFITNEGLVFFLNTTIVTISITSCCVAQTHGILYAMKEYFGSSNPKAIQAANSRNSRSQSLRSKLFEIIENVDGFASFQAHLSDEFSTENLMFFVEICKFRMILKKALEGERDFDKVYEENDFDVLEFSWVIQPNDFQGFFFKMYALHLFQKYCQTSSKHQVNLAEKSLTEIKDGLENASYDGLINIFDDAQHECWSLMQDSFRRYVEGDRYARLYPNNESDAQMDKLFIPEYSSRQSISLMHPGMFKKLSVFQKKGSELPGLKEIIVESKKDENKSIIP